MNERSAVQRLGLEFTEASPLDKMCVLAVIENSDVLAVLDEELLNTAPKCRLERATGYHDGIQFLASLTHDLVILDALCSQAPDLLDAAVKRPSPYPVVMLIPHWLDRDIQRRLLEMGVKALFRLEDLRGIVPFLERLVTEKKTFARRGFLKKLFPFCRLSPETRRAGQWKCQSLSGAACGRLKKSVYYGEEI